MGRVAAVAAAVPLLLALRAGSDYPSLVRSRILESLGMHGTTIALSPAHRSRMATGHDVALRPVSHWDLPAPAMAEMLATRRPTGAAEVESALVWQALSQDGHEIVTHGGGTEGFRSFVGLDRTRGVGVVVLSNSGELVRGADGRANATR